MSKRCILFYVQHESEILLDYEGLKSIVGFILRIAWIKNELECNKICNLLQIMNIVKILINSQWEYTLVIYNIRPNQRSNKDNSNLAWAQQTKQNNFYCFMVLIKPKF